MKLQATIDRQKKELAKQRQKLAKFHDEDCKPYLTCLWHAVITHSTVIANEDECEDLDIESQDEEDMGCGVRPSGGFTSAVSIQPHADIELKYVIDNFKG